MCMQLNGFNFSANNALCLMLLFDANACAVAISVVAVLLKYAAVLCFAVYYSFSD